MVEWHTHTQSEEEGMRGIHLNSVCDSHFGPKQEHFSQCVWVVIEQLFVRSLVTHGVMCIRVWIRSFIAPFYDRLFGVWRATDMHGMCAERQGIEGGRDKRQTQESHKNAMKSKANTHTQIQTPKNVGNFFNKKTTTITKSKCAKRNDWNELKTYRIQYSIRELLRLRLRQWNIEALANY